MNKNTQDKLNRLYSELLDIMFNRENDDIIAYIDNSVYISKSELEKFYEITDFESKILSGILKNKIMNSAKFVNSSKEEKTNDNR